MARRILIFFIFSVATVGCGNWYGDVKLGNDFVYIVDPAFNEIYLAFNSNKPYSGGNTIIENIQALGHNKDYILVVSKDDNMLFWIIDKNQEQRKIGFKNERILMLSNINSSTDSNRFKNLIRTENIKMKSVNYYREKYNYQ